MILQAATELAPPANRCDVDFQLSLESEHARSAYPKAPVAVDPSVSVAGVLRLLQTERSGAAIVCEADRLVGIFTERDALRLMAEGAELGQPVREAMTTPPSTAPASATVGELIRRMSEGGYRHLPLVDPNDAGCPIGMVDVRGIVHYLVEHFPSAIYNLPPNSQQSHTEREGA